VASNPRIALIDYGAGNLRSASKALERVCAQGKVIVTSEAAALADATHIVLPGVGAFADCYQGLHGIVGMREALEIEVRDKGKPFLGICVGMQLLASKGLEYGEHKGLGWINGVVAPLPVDTTQYKLPHMGWNSLHFTRQHPICAGVQEGAQVYFVHSYAFTKNAPDSTVATTSYDGDVVAIVAQDNIIGLQFHPEKSQSVGMQILKNFVEWQA
jgi:glutamine amidotransferase